MTVFRIEKTRDYTVMSNHHLKDRTLTLKSKGLLSMMLSLPDEWNYTTRGLAAICREGVDSIGAALKELETHGYIRRTQLRDEKGKITDTEYVIYEMPQCEPPSSPGTPLPGTAKPYTENPDMGVPDTAEPCTENPAQLNTNQTKRSIVGVFLNTKDDILICDPEAEYFPLVNRLEGQVIKISPTSTQYVNPMDINLNYSEDDNPLALKSDFILSFCELAAGGRNGLEPVEKTVIDRAVRIVYRPYIADPRPENMPLLEDLYDEIKRQPEPEAQRIAAALELYVHGSLNVFNHRTNVDINNRIVCFDIKELGKQLKSLGMLVIQDQVWNRVSQNRDQGKSTWYFVDEFHLLLRGEVGTWSVEIWKRFRKWGGIPTGITQNIKDLLSSPEIENIFENSDFVYLLNQASGDRKILCERLNISNQQAAHISNAGPGEGLIFFGNVILPFVDDFPKDNELYSIMTTKLGETGKGENEHE